MSLELSELNPEDKWYLNVEWRKANPETGESYVHEHDDYGMHPVTRKHRTRKFKATRRGKFIDYYFGRRWLFAFSFKTEHDAERARVGFNRKDSIGKEGVLDYVLDILEDKVNG